jgi:hypothetical protein
MRFPDRVDFDANWIFVQGSYSNQLQKAKFWCYFTNSNAVMGLEWNDNDKRNPPPSLKFILGNSNPGDVSGYNFQYS